MQDSNKNSTTQYHPLSWEGDGGRLLLFDFGCVIVNLDKQRCVNALYKVGCGAIAGYVDEHRSEDLFHEIELGGSTETFCDEARRQSSFTDETGEFHPCTTPDEDIIWAWNELLTGIDVEKLRLIKHLRDNLGYKTAILSNTNWMHWDKSVKDFFGIDGYKVEDYFDHVFLSCELGMVKPDPRIYQHVIDTTGVKADNIIFFDDSARNCEGARQCGINAIHDPHGSEWVKILSKDNYELRTVNCELKTAAVIGNFDGVHQGHRYILDELKEVAENEHLTPLAITFDKHPRAVFLPDFKPSYINTIPEKIALLQKEVGNVKVLAFNMDLANVTAYNFMKDYLRDEMGVKVLLLGYDNRFGKRNNDENFDTYCRYGEELGIKVIQAHPIDVKGIRVSSSQVRHAIADGRMEEATFSLGRPFSITGCVIEGHQEGRRIGFPTANILPPCDKIMPPNGVYATNVIIDGNMYKGMTNVGTRPTYQDDSADKTVTIETNIFDFNEDIYGKDITVEFLHKVRDEQQFDSPKALKAQITKDKETILHQL